MNEFIFRQGRTVIELPLPAIPFEITQGVNLQTVNISELGEVLVGGKKSICSLNLSFMLPKKEYYFCSKKGEPEEYYKTFLKWSTKNKVVRFIVTNSPINIAVLIESVTYRVQDTTGDAYITLKMTEYRELEATKEVGTGKNTGLRARAKSSSGKTYNHKIVYGDRLCWLCRKYYGSEAPKYYNAVARYNNQPNPHLIKCGTVLKFPPKEELGL